MRSALAFHWRNELQPSCSNILTVGLAAVHMVKGVHAHGIGHSYFVILVHARCHIFVSTLTDLEVRAIVRPSIGAPGRYLTSIVSHLLTQKCHMPV